MIALLRHGERADDHEAKYEGPESGVDFDPPLTAKGKEQAFQSGELIRARMRGGGGGEAGASGAELLPVAEQVEIVTSPFLRCIQTAVHVAKGLGLKTEAQVGLKVEWAMSEFLAPSLFSTWKGAESPLGGLVLCRESEQDFHDKFLDGFAGKVVWSEKQARPEYPEHISQCKSRYRRHIQRLMIQDFRGEANRGKLILLVSHAYSAEEFMRLFEPFKCYSRVDYCSFSVAVKKSFKAEDEIEDGPASPCAGGEGFYGPWELVIANDARHVGLLQTSPVEFDTGL